MSAGSRSKPTSQVAERQRRRRVFVRGKPGAIDTTFGDAGTALGGYAGALACHHLLVHADDKIDAVCTLKYLYSVVMRFLPDGAPDVSFGNKGSYSQMAPRRERCGTAA